MSLTRSQKRRVDTLVRRDGRVYLESLHVGRVYLFAGTGCWRGEFASGDPVTSKADSKIIDFARRCDVVTRMMEAIGR